MSPLLPRPLPLAGLAWLTGFRRVPDNAVVTKHRFGRFVGALGPGWHWTLPGLDSLGQPVCLIGHHLDIPAEPGTNAEIRSFCKSNYDVTFPLFSKVVVKGTGIHPLFAHLTDAKANPEAGGDIRWNFTKFLVDRKGNVVARFEPADEPQSDKVVDAIEKALAEPR